MQTTTNVFLDGLTTDMHPLTTKNNQLTDALNATLRTYNGNELVLQNDMGNTLIKDSLTEKEMKLSEGFIPVGMKEYGGVLYIASYNPEKKEGELGSIPSPLIKYTYDPDQHPAKLGTEEELTEISTDDTTPETDAKHLGGTVSDIIYPISEKVLKVGDLFRPIINLNLPENLNGNLNKKVKSTYDNDKAEYYLLTNSLGKGYYKLVPYSITEERGIAPLALKDKYPLNDIPKYWFLIGNSSDKDQFTRKCVSEYHVYPNIPRGILAFGIEAEIPNNFEMYKNDTTGKNSPFYYYSNTVGQTNEEYIDEINQDFLQYQDTVVLDLDDQLHINVFDNEQ